VDFRDNVVMKENYSFLVADADGAVGGGEKGLYNRDTRFLSRYCWDLGQGLQTLQAHAARLDRFEAHLGRIEGHAQTLAAHREVALEARTMRDRVTLHNTGPDAVELRPRLELEADFLDLFEARGWFAPPDRRPEREESATRVHFGHRARDGMAQGIGVRVAGPGATITEYGAAWRVRLAPGERAVLEALTTIENPVDAPRAGIDYQTWRASFAGTEVVGCGGAAIARAVDDLRGLLLFTEDGPVPAAGIPWYVAAFGRDALLTAHLLLPSRPDVAEGTLRYLARLQGTTTNAARLEQPGKIPHEIRFGELARIGAVPHTPFYGTVDATPLFVWLLGALAETTGSDVVVRALRPAWEAALAWMTGPGDADGDGFLEFDSTPTRPGSGLAVQSWKDAGDSMTHADGSLAAGAIAVSEVQGYAYAAYRAAAGFYRSLGEPGPAASWEARARELRARFHEAFWLEELGSYALALDGEKRPLKVHASDAGQLLWTGIVPPETAPAVVRALFDARLWSGWGFRTLATGERRYNPVSYHNGSVWPHDTALIARGLARYGFTERAGEVARAVLDLAELEPDRRLPELVAGYARGAAPAVPYPVACRPQAWDAAALLALARLLP